MEFFGREEELRELRKVREVARKHARFTVVTGRRRVGKTELLKKAFGDGETPCLYLLVTKNPELKDRKVSFRALSVKDM